MMRAVTTLQLRLKQARESAGLTQSEVAEKVGITQPTYSELERGESMGSKHLPQIAKVLGVSVYWLESGISQESSDLPGWEKILESLAQASPETRDQALRILEAFLGK